MEDKIHKYVGFKLLSLTVIDHPILGNNTFNFIDEYDEPDSIYFSVMIGPNGTGKSEILGLIITMYRNISRLEKDLRPIRTTGWYQLTYSNFGYIYTFSNIPTDYAIDSVDSLNPNSKVHPYLLENGSPEKFDGFKNASRTLPIALIANSIMLTDKFFVPRNNDEEREFPEYRYLGVRQRPQQASTRYYVRKTVEFIVGQIDSKAFNDGIKRITKFFGSERNVHVLFYTSFTRYFFHGELHQEHLDDYYNPILEKYSSNRGNTPRKALYYEKIKKDSNKIDELCNFINKLKKENRLEHQHRSSVKILRYNIGDNTSHNQLKAEFSHIEELRKLGILSPPEVTFVDDSEVHLQNTSSGEFHFFSTMIGLMATIKPNSLILIDEPEISLHPNWQMQYIHFLRHLFSNEAYKSCQIIIASHSHFIVSDLKGGSSNIIGLKRIENRITTINHSGKNTFGWSAEDVLYNIFDVRTTRNFYFENDLNSLIELLNRGSNDYERIEKLVTKFKEIKIDGVDPLNVIIEKANKYLIENNA